MSNLFNVREAEAGDVSFIINSWLKSYWRTAAKYAIPKYVFFKAHHGYVEECLKRSTIYCAVSKEDKTQILGWLCMEPSAGDRCKTLHYMYVKFPYRHFGIAKELLQKAIEEEAFSYTHYADGRLAEFVRRKGFYDPYRFYGGS